MIRRMQQRRGTASDWTTANPILASGEFGFETDTGKFKIGNGLTAWSGLQYFATLTAIKSEIVDSAPAALDTLNELANALNDDASYATTITNVLALKAPLASPTFSGTVNFSNALVTGITLPINWMGTYDNNEEYAENDMVHYDGSVYYATGENLNNSEGYYPTAVGADWELFASKGDTGPTGNTGSPGADGEDGGFDSTQTVESVSTSRSLSSSDVGKLITNSAAITITVTGLSVGQQVDFIQTNSSQITFAAGSGVTLYSKNSRVKTAGQYSPATIKCIASNTYVLIGDIGE
jgi:hypothetical protein